MSNLDLIDLDYEDAEPVELDIRQIVRRGSRLRRDRLITRSAAAVVVLGLVPLAVATDLGRQHSASHPAVAGSGFGGRGALRHQEAAPASPQYGPEVNGPAIAGAAGAISGGLQPAEARESVTLPRSYGPVRGLTADRSGQGAWFWDSTARQVRVFHVSATAGLASWPVPYPVRALAVGPASQVAVVLRGSGRVLILSASKGKVRPVLLASSADQPASKPFTASPYGWTVRCAGPGSCTPTPERRAPDPAGDLWIASRHTVTLLTPADRPRFR